MSDIHAWPSASTTDMDGHLWRNAQLKLTGLVGFVGALMVTAAQLASQLPALAWVTETQAQLIAAMAAPLCIAGYVHVSLAMRPAQIWQRMAVLVSGGYAFALGAQWLGSQFYLGLITDAFGYSSASAEATIANLLVVVADENEPLLWAHEAGIAVASVVLMLAILSGSTLYPKWLAAFSPIVLLAAAMAIGSYVPVWRNYFEPAAMSIAHAVFFGLSTLSVTAQHDAQPPHREP